MFDHHAKEKGKQFRKNKEGAFTCRYCGRTVSEAAPGTSHRNHCPWCLRSIHVDNQPGDRASFCGGVMEPIAISVRKGKEWVIIHRCRDCGALRENRTAGDDNELALLSLAVHPIAVPPFPLAELYKRQSSDQVKKD